MVVLPLLSLFLSGGMIGWASAPYNPAWQRRYPQRAALMALAGPAMNFLLAVVSGLLIRVGIAGGFFQEAGIAGGIGMLLEICFKLNVLLGIFNLLPFPPFDGFGALGLLTGRVTSLENVRSQLSQFSFIGLLVGWQAIRFVFPPVFAFAQSVLIGQ
jgi:Zn-dependent protease